MDPKLIEPPVRLSQSKLWQIQRNYFKSMGITAWKKEVPFYISSNAFIAHRYALLVLNFFKDWMHKHPRTHETFYLFEMGAGTGKFSFYFLKALKELLQTYHMNETKFCYVITDVIEKNVTFCEQNPSFKPFIESGEVDFAIFNVETDTDFHLRLKNKTYSALREKTPLLIIANYTMDCIQQDAFKYFDGKLQEMKFGLRSRYKNFDVDQSLHLDDLRFDFAFYDVDTTNYYEDPKLNHILRQYEKHFKDKQASIMMPLGAIQFFDNMTALSKNNLFMIVGDKGIAEIDNFALISDQYRFTYDGCYSFLVNFHALGEYLKQQNGDYLLTDNYNEFKVNLYTAGYSFSELTETKSCFNTFMESLGPDEYCWIYDEFTTSCYRFGLKSLLSFLRMSEWDPNAYSIIHSRVMELMPGATPQLKRDMNKAVERVAQKIYDLGIGDDVYNHIGIYYEAQKQDEKALTFFNDSVRVFKEHGASHVNLGIIYERQKNITKALKNYQDAYSIEPKNQYAKRKFLTLTGKPYLVALIPVLRTLFVISIIGAALYYITH